MVRDASACSSCSTATGVATGRLPAGTTVDVVFRPEGLQLLPPEVPGGLAGRILDRAYTGEATFYRVGLDVGGDLLVAGPIRAGDPGDRVGVAFREGGPPPALFAHERPGAE